MIKRRLLDVQSGYGNESKQRLRAIFSVIVFIEKMMREAEKLNNAFSIFCVTTGALFSGKGHNPDCARKLQTVWPGLSPSSRLSIA